MTRVACFPRSGIPREGEGYRKGRTFPDFAVHRDGSSIALDDLRHNVQSHAQPADHALLGSSGPVEALKDFVALLSRDTQAMIADTDGDRVFRGGEIYLDGLGVGSILDGILQQVGDDLSQPVSIPKQAGPHRALHQDAMTRMALLIWVSILERAGAEACVPCFASCRASRVVCNFKAVSGVLSSWLAMPIKASLRCSSSLRAELSSAKPTIWRGRSWKRTPPTSTGRRLPSLHTSSASMGVCCPRVVTSWIARSKSGACSGGVILALVSVLLRTSSRV